MSASQKSKRPWLTAVLLAAALAIWIYDQKKSLSGGKFSRSAQHEKSPASESRDARRDAPEAGQHAAENDGRYEVYRNCTLSEARNNDGDSFMVRLPNGKQAEFRLYFVDTPESAFKSYAGGESNHQRIAQQAAELGGITPEQAVEIGQQAKHFTLALLAERPFTLYTEWDSPFHDRRYHAHVEVFQNGKPRWLHQVLVEKGFVRIITKPADLPDGTPAAREKDHLRQLESDAKRGRIGVWKL
jgi:endonuclease YncB( thermonuclease family)